MLRILIGWLAAVGTAAVFGSLVQSQLTLGAVERMGQQVVWRERLTVFAHDLMYFAPLWAAIMALGLLLAFLVAGWLARRSPFRRPALFPLAGLAAVLAALGLMEVMLPVTAIGAAGSLAGVVGLSLGGALAGGVYLALVPYRQNGQN